MHWHQEPVIGLINSGSICYFNSVLQALFGCSSFIKYMKHARNKEVLDIYYGESVTSNLALLNEVNKGLTRKFTGQQCSNEFLIQFIDYLSKTMNVDKINHLFRVEYDSKLYCRKCNIVKKINNDTMYSIQVPENYQGSIEDMVNNGYIKVEEYVCDKKHKNCTYKLNVIKQLPHILVITLGKYFKKNNIHYPMKIDIETMDKIHKYKLVSVIDHYGTIHSGHYMCRSIRNQKIFLFDDTRIIPDYTLSPSEASYMLFYHII